MKPIFIVGYMACGKTTFARALARQLNISFYDLDFCIEQRFHTTIPEIFRDKGEACFRNLEAEMLREIGEFENVVIACGGGTPCYHDNMDYMVRRGVTVWLQASLQCTVRRVNQRPGKRPLLKDLQNEELIKKINSDLEIRTPFYSPAQIHFNGDQLENARQINLSVKKFLDLHQDVLE